MVALLFLQATTCKIYISSMRHGCSGLRLFWHLLYVCVALEDLSVFLFAGTGQDM